jgi:CheY-like chemotaxis protein
MVLLYDATGLHNVRWVQAAPAGMEAIAVSDIAAYDDMHARAAGVVAFVRDHEDPALLERLGTFRALYPLKFLIVLRPSPESPLLSLSADEILYGRTDPDMLWSVIRTVEANGLLHRLADVIRSTETMPIMLRLALMHTLLRPSPISSIKELAAEIGCERRTLPRSWELYFDSWHDRLIDFLDWVTLLYVTGRKAPKRPWTVIARDVGVTEETLARSVRRLIGLSSLSELAVHGQPIVLNHFRIVFERLFGQWPGDLAAERLPAREFQRVLVVDDHEAVRQFLDHSLRRAGFDTVIAAAGDEALVQIARANEPPTVVVTDIKMPGMDGIELARRIAQQWPSVRIILMSAFVVMDGIELEWLCDELSHSIRFLAKPFTAGRAVALLRETCETFP